MRQALITWLLLMTVLTGTAHAQEYGAPVIAPLPMGEDNSLARIASPETSAANDALLTTHTPAKAALKPVAQDRSSPAPLAGFPRESIAPIAAPMPLKSSATSSAPAAYMPAKIPFGHAEPPPPSIPSGPHTAIAIPVPNVDSVEVSEPAPPTPVAPGADPVKEDPATPTEFTSPIFDPQDPSAPRKIVIRVLNKVTAQSAQLKAKPGEVLRFGKLEIRAVTCHKSRDTSPLDYAGLLDIHEKINGSMELKPIFFGWMYASSPSIAALEHPVYDVTMVSCDMAGKPDTASTKPGEKDAKSKTPDTAPNAAEKQKKP